MFGPHVNRYHATGKRPSMAAHIEAACREAAADGDFRVGAVAFFVSDTRALEINLHPDERAPLRALIKRTGLRAIAHSSYKAFPWNGNPAGAAFLREELKVCQEAGVEGLVVHLPKEPISTVLKYLHRLVEPTVEGVRVYFETPAVVPSETYYETPKKLAALFKAIRERDPELARFGLCVDTSHLWVSGNDMQSYEAADTWFRELEDFKEIIPHDRIMLHLNDSRTPRGHGPDEHAGFGLGKIWQEYCLLGFEKSGLAAVVDYARRHNMPAILERKPKEALKLDYRILHSLAPECRISQKRGGTLVLQDEDVHALEREFMGTPVAEADEDHSCGCGE